jgi:serine/threonine protein kinase/lipoprotein NlpI
VIGTTVSHYRILDKLGAGGMGEVYLALDTKLDRKVALKFLPPALQRDAEARERLLREARSASKLDHPSIVTVHAVEESVERPFIAMAYIDGLALDVHLNRAGREEERCLQLAIQMAEGLEKAHQAGIVHRDLKPSNVMVDKDGRARILDFGLAQMGGAAKLTQTGSTLGTAHYMSPEQAQGRRVGPESDVFSFGVLLYEMLSGRQAFTGEHPVAIAYAITHEEPAPLNGVSPALQSIVARCLRKEPGERYDKFSDVLDELRKIRESSVTACLPTSSDRPSIAVLPFANMSADPENEYFADGLTEELLNVLARNAQLRVTARTSSFVFKGKHVDLREVGQKLGVRTILEGSVRKAGNRARITAQLVNVSDGFHLWSDTYDRVLDDIFAVQDDIARSVAGALNVTLLGATPARRSQHPGAYRLYLQARYFTMRHTRKDMKSALKLYGQALELDEGDPLIWSGLAWVLFSQQSYGIDIVTNGYAQAKEAAARALSLDAACADAHRVMGVLKHNTEFDWAAARKHLQKALELEPSSARALSALGFHLICTGQADEAIKLLGRAVELDPLAPGAYNNLGIAYSSLGRSAEAVTAFEKVLEISPGFVSGHARLGLEYLAMGQPDRALTTIKEEAEGGYRSYGLTVLYHALGSPDESAAELARLESLGDQWAFQIAVVTAYRGDRDAAFRWLERARAKGDPGLPMVAALPLLSGLHDDPRWTAFLAELGLAK